MPAYRWISRALTSSYHLQYDGLLLLLYIVSQWSITDLWYFNCNIHPNKMHRIMMMIMMPTLWTNAKEKQKTEKKLLKWSIYEVKCWCEIIYHKIASMQTKIYFCLQQKKHENDPFFLYIKGHDSFILFYRFSSFDFSVIVRE